MSVGLLLEACLWATLLPATSTREFRGSIQEPEWRCPLNVSSSIPLLELAEFWDGSDAVSNKTMDDDFSLEGPSFLQSSASDQSASDALLFGMFDSGTNLLEKFTKQNIPGFRISNARFGKIWKHLYPAQILRRVPPAKRQRTLLMA